MKTTRREYIRGGFGIGLAAPLMLLASQRSGYSAAEVKEKLKLGKGTRGVTKLDLPTPSLIIDLDRLKANISRLAQHTHNSGMHVRPHAKTHKCSEIAHRQIKAGALGVCTATIYEAEAMANANVPGILITSECVGPDKMRRLVQVTKKRTDTMSVVDNAAHAARLSEAAQGAKVQLNVMVDITTRWPGRTGIKVTQAVALAKKIDQLPSLRLWGIHGYSGSSAHVTGFAERKLHSQTAMAPLLEAFAEMKRAGLPVEIMSGGSTGTYNIDTGLNHLAGMTELQAGSYVFMDVDYRRIGGKDGGEVYEDFKPSLTVLATVISKNSPGRATLDAGLKAFATDRKFGPEVVGIPGVEYRFGGDEHGILNLENASRDIRLSEKVELLIPHCDPNVNLYDRAYCVRGEDVVDVWKIDARGHV